MEKGGEEVTKEENLWEMTAGGEVLVDEEVVAKEENLGKEGCGTGNSCTNY